MAERARNEEERTFTLSNEQQPRILEGIELGKGWAFHAEKPDPSFVCRPRLRPMPLTHIHRTDTYLLEIFAQETRFLVVHHSIKLDGDAMLFQQQ
jgi:hypothetical protein